MNRRQFLMSALATGCLATTRAWGQTGPGGAGAGSGNNRRQPNVLLIFVDDLGYADLGCYGSEEVPTPNIDALAQRGIRFTDGYVTAPVCAPSRAGLLTGRNQARFGILQNPKGRDPNDTEELGLPSEETPIATAMKKAGYATGIVGKWHQGYEPEVQPHNRGFDEFFGIVGGMRHFNENPPDAPWWMSLQRNDEVLPEPGTYIADVWTDEAVSFIERHKDGPWFLYFSHTTPHVPMQAKPEILERFSHIEDEKRRALVAMMVTLDENVGRVTEKLRDLGIEDDTLVLFISDNGGKPSANASYNDPLSGQKGTVREGGIRVPFIASWPGTLPQGVVYEKPVSTLDVLPTALAIAGRDPQAMIDKPLDGVNLMPYLTGKNSGVPHETLYWRYGGQRAMRQGDWKILRGGKGDWQLYNLAQDISESNNLAKERPDLLAELVAKYDHWERESVAANPG